MARLRGGYRYDPCTPLGLPSVDGSLGNQTSWEKWWEKSAKTPLHEEVEAQFDPSKERIKAQNYQEDLKAGEGIKKKSCCRCCYLLNKEGVVQVNS